MTEFLKLTVQLQILLVAGYFAHKVMNVGRNIPLDTRDFLFQTLALGFLGQIIVIAVSSLLDVSADFNAIEKKYLTYLVIANIIVSLAIGASWRKFGSNLFSRTMGGLGVYRDDHETSVWSSIMQSDAKWVLVQVHIDDGRVIESEFSKIPTGAPMGKITLNQDGIAIYPTAIYRADSGDENETEVYDEGYGYQITYIQKENIKQIDISWK